MATKMKTKRGEKITGKAPYDKAGSKSDHIRTYLKSHRNKQQRRPMAIVEHLAEHGIDVKPELVSSVKQNLQKKASSNGKAAATTKPGRPPKAKSTRSSAQKKAWRKRKKADNQLESLVAAKGLLEACGGDRAKAATALDTIEALQV